MSKLLSNKKTIITLCSILCMSNFLCGCRLTNALQQAKDLKKNEQAWAKSTGVIVKEVEDKYLGIEEQAKNELPELGNKENENVKEEENSSSSLSKTNLNKKQSEESLIKFNESISDDSTNLSLLRIAPITIGKNRYFYINKDKDKIGTVYYYGPNYYNDKEKKETKGEEWTDEIENSYRKMGLQVAENILGYSFCKKNYEDENTNIDAMEIIYDEEKDLYFAAIFALLDNVDIPFFNEHKDENTTYFLLASKDKAVQFFIPNKEIKTPIGFLSYDAWQELENQLYYRYIKNDFYVGGNDEIYATLPFNNPITITLSKDANPTFRNEKNAVGFYFNNNKNSTLEIYYEPNYAKLDSKDGDYIMSGEYILSKEALLQIYNCSQLYDANDGKSINKTIGSSEGLSFEFDNNENNENQITYFYDSELNVFMIAKNCDQYIKSIGINSTYAQSLAYIDNSKKYFEHIVKKEIKTTDEKKK